MKINVYPIVSALHEDEFIRKARTTLFQELEDFTGFDFRISDIDSLYEGDLALILVESGGSENQFLKVYPQLKAPFIFLTYKHNNSLAASMEILTFLGRNNQRGEILHGDSETIAKRLKTMTKGLSNRVNLGLFGTPSDWLISCKVDEALLKEKLNIKLVHITSEELIETYHEFDEKKCEDKTLLGKFEGKELDKAYRIYLAIKKLVKKYKLAGFTIRCFDLLDSLKSTSCLALALLNDEGVIGTCEGDVPALISMYLIKKTLGKVSFQANPSEIDTNNSEILLAHCTLPLKMTNAYKLTTHYESGIGIAIKGELDLGKCFIFRLSPDLDRFVLLDGVICENLSRMNLCRTQIKVKVKKNISYFLTNPLGNHHIVVYGDDYDKLVSYLNDRNITRL